MALGVLPSDIDEMGCNDFARLADYYQCEPFGPVRDNIHSGMIAASICNVNRGKNTKPVTANDFLLKTQEEQVREKNSAFIASLRQLARKKNA